MSATLLLVRHARTAANAAGRTQGREDHPLDEVGEEQAAALAPLIARIGPSALYSSPALRARSTAEPVGSLLGLPVHLDDRLQELDHGALGGLTGLEMRELHPEILARWRDDPADVVLPGGESLRQAQHRMRRAIAAIVETHPDGTTLVVSHNLALRAYLCRVLEVPLDCFRRLRTDLASLSIVDVNGEGGARLVALNERCHLDPDASSSGPGAPAFASP